MTHPRMHSNVNLYERKKQEICSNKVKQVGAELCQAQEKSRLAKIALACKKKLLSTFICQ